jgi:hypothetical protein
VIYSSNPKKWFGKYLDWEGNCFGKGKDTESIDHKTREAEMKK